MANLAWRGGAALALWAIVPIVAGAEPASRCQPVVAQQNSPIYWAEGLAIATEISSRVGRYQSLKKLESVSASAGIRIAYTDNSPVRPTTKPIYRFVSEQDLREAEVYDQSFSSDSGEIKQGATALGPSTSVVQSLKQTGSAHASIHSLTEDTLILGQFSLLERQPVQLPVIINDQETALPALHLRGSFGNVSGEFWIYDNSDMPLTLMYRIASESPDWQELRVVEITVPGEAKAVPNLLAHGGCVALHDIHFDFDKDELRPEAEPILTAVADVLHTHPMWHLVIDGYTDNVGPERYNLDLSRRRAGSVAQELIQRHRIDAVRLTPRGFGSEGAVASNGTAIGRALNRRVEIFRVSP